MPGARQIAELAHRREIVQHAGCGGRRLKVDPAPVEAEHLVQAGLRLVPGFLARLGEVDADRDRSDLALRTVVAELAQQLLVFAVAAPSPRRQVIAAPRGPGHTLDRAARLTPGGGGWA